MSSDGPDRVLGAVVRLLPERRREWGAAMRAELAALDVPGQRRRHAAGCVRAVLALPGAWQPVAEGIVALGTAVGALAFAAAIPSAGVRTATAVVLLLLGVLTWAGHRPGLVGPVATGAGARTVRAAASLAVAALVLIFLQPPWNGGADRGPEGWWLPDLLFVFCYAAVLAATADRPRGPDSMRVIATASLAGALVWWLALVASSQVRALPRLALTVVAITVVLAVLARGRRGVTETLHAGLLTATTTCLLIFTLSVGSYTVAPSLVPDYGTTDPHWGLTAADREEHTRIESTDPYVAELLLAALAGVALLGTVIARRPGAPAPSTPDP